MGAGMGARSCLLLVARDKWSGGSRRGLLVWNQKSPPCHGDRPNEQI